MDKDKYMNNADTYLNQIGNATANLESMKGASEDHERKHFFEVLNSKIIRDYFANDMSCPCDACPMASSCATTEKECSAFRNWSTKGKYTEEQIQKHLRVPTTY